MRLGQPAYLRDFLCALDLRDVTDGKEDGRLGEAVHGHLQQAGDARVR